ncbi:PRC-barrel domain-containing protein [Palleronia sp. LCG004]|uniref:PRC-barrel domain-containing protein n=1 Tax=Palleronia sp. LCG004 TaxID=3079304 RepID=UPI0029429EDC|nr:PRC-barrel domain-containing protein [Palleronia sp. LCG004]WOI55237.1 PRC-barrel domain-containing protein [Palleronia sp. LCG004]
MKLLTVSALAMGLATTGAYAQSSSDSAAGDAMSSGTATASDGAQLIRTRDITGGNIYTTGDASDWTDGEMYDGVGENWNDIGEIEDIVLDQSGQMVGIVAEIGGFLDIADKHVMIPLENVNLVAVDDQTYAYVTNRTEEELEQMEDVDEGFWN